MGLISLLSCGGSILKSWEGRRDADDIVVGVNWVGHYHQTDYLCFKDEVVLDRSFLLPRIGFVNSGHVTQLWKGRRSYENFKRWDGVTGWGGQKVCGFTFPDALRWCLEKWPDDSVHVYGCDMDDEANIGGSTFGHDEARWKAERRFINHMVKLHGHRIRFVGCRCEEFLMEF